MRILEAVMILSIGMARFHNAVLLFVLGIMSISICFIFKAIGFIKLIILSIGEKTFPLTGWLWAIKFDPTLILFAVFVLIVILKEFFIPIVSRILINGILCGLSLILFGFICFSISSPLYLIFQALTR